MWEGVTARRCALVAFQDSDNRPCGCLESLRRRELPPIETGTGMNLED
jgi:hypothetical protein